MPNSEDILKQFEDFLENAPQESLDALYHKFNSLNSDGVSFDEYVNMLNGEFCDIEEDIEVSVTIKDTIEVVEMQQKIGFEHPIQIEGVSYLYSSSEHFFLAA